MAALRHRQGDFSGGDPLTLAYSAIFVTTGLEATGEKGFDFTRAKPVAVARHGRPVIVVMAVEEFERLKALDALATALARVKKAKE